MQLLKATTWLPPLSVFNIFVLIQRCRQCSQFFFLLFECYRTDGSYKADIQVYFFRASCVSLHAPPPHSVKKRRNISKMQLPVQAISVDWVSLRRHVGVSGPVQSLVDCWTGSLRDVFTVAKFFTCSERMWRTVSTGGRCHSQWKCSLLFKVTR